MKTDLVQIRSYLDFEIRPYFVAVKEAKVSRGTTVMNNPNN